MTAALTAPPLTEAAIRAVMFDVGLLEASGRSGGREYRWWPGDSVASLHVAMSALDPRPEAFRLTSRHIVFVQDVELGA